MDKYELGICKRCGKRKPLKNGYCIDCQTDLPDCFKDIFGGFSREGEVK